MRSSIPTLFAFFLLAARAFANPEDLGGLPVVVWDAGAVDAASLSLPTTVYRPGGAAVAAPVVVVMHGLVRNGSYHEVLGRTFASRGVIALVPDWPCSLLGCDQSAAADAAIALLDWAEAQGGAIGSELEGRVDGERRALVGHSAGGLAVFLAAARDPRMDSVVGFDPVDQGSQAQGSVSLLPIPSLHLAAANPGLCSSSWGATVYPLAPAPKRLVTVAGSGHCDPEDPTDFLCAAGCVSTGSASTTPLFRRLAVAWTTCLLGVDPSMQSWVTGSDFDGDVASGDLVDVESSGIGGIACGETPGDDDDATGGDDDVADDDTASDDDSTETDDDSTTDDDDATVTDDDSGEETPADSAPPGSCACESRPSGGSAIGVCTVVAVLVAVSRRGGSTAGMLRPGSALPGGRGFGAGMVPCGSVRRRAWVAQPDPPTVPTAHAARGPVRSA